jgi:hypothetical protein
MLNKYMKKLVKKLKIPQMKQMDRIDEIYDVEEKEDVPAHFKDYEELEFYNDDFEFMRHHKRTMKNMKESLQRYVEKNANTGVTSHMFDEFLVTITLVKLNKACTLLHVWWDIILLETSFRPDSSKHSKSHII